MLGLSNCVFLPNPENAQRLARYLLCKSGEGVLGLKWLPLITGATMTKQEEHEVLMATDRRQAIRYACILEAVGEGQTRRFGDGWVARVLNISTSGIGMHLGERFADDTVLTLALHGASHTLKPVRVRVAHSTEKPDGTWYIGAAFEKPLTEAELDQLL
jgi:hypothetical protein